MEHILHILLVSGLLLGSLCVLFSRNPVHSVMFLITVFICGAGILLYFGAEFIALIFIIVYVGAIAVLFLFIVMMLTIKTQSITIQQTHIMPFIVLAGFLTIIEAYLSFDELFFYNAQISVTSSWVNLLDNLTNTEIIGQVFFQEFFLCFLLCGILLLIAMVGAIALTQNFSSNRKNDLTIKQLSRRNNSFLSF